MPPCHLCLYRPLTEPFVPNRPEHYMLSAFVSEEQNVDLWKIGAARSAPRGRRVGPAVRSSSPGAENEAPAVPLGRRAASSAIRTMKMVYML